MAGKRSRSRKARGGALFSPLARVIWLLVIGGSVAGWAKPDLPILGPLIQQLSGGVTFSDGTISTEGPGAAADQPKTAAGNGAGEASSLRSPVVSPDYSSPSGDAEDTIRIASFNIQVFGESKLGKSWVVEVLARIVRQFEIVAIQEIRSKEQHVVPEFVELVNREGSQYNYVIGPRLGRTISKEQYAFLYDTAEIEIDTSSPGTIQDPNDQMHREPFVARFRARTPDPRTSFTFWLVNAHTDPDEVAEEVDVLADVFLVMQTARPEEDDVILLGDLNAAADQFGALGQIPGITWAVRDATTNTRRTAMYDNLLFDRRRTAEYTGTWGVYDYEAAFQLTRQQALSVSDHLPVWAEFQVHEAAAVDAALHSPPASMLR